MSARERGEGHPDVEMDMTPMIDCIFQLIIFFFLIIDLQDQELEPLKLPKAIHAVPDEPPPEQVRPILNVLQDGTIVYRRHKLWVPAYGEKNYQKLKDQLIFWIKSGVMKKKYDPDVKRKLVDDPLLIRADKWTEMHHIAKIMETCGDKDVQIWKVQLAVGEPKNKKRGVKKE